ncbi:MAG: hypothetical protein U9R19_13995 [Bacteroidota bacterium]|nr:hypothetical protein [Bacteroidota bacterium]
MNDKEIQKELYDEIKEICDTLAERISTIERENMRHYKQSQKDKDEFWFRNMAATAMNSILLAPDTYGTETPESIANLSVGYAIAMMKEIKSYETNNRS